MKEINYTIAVPPSWVLDNFYSCNEVTFQRRDERAYISVHSEALWNYSSNRDQAFDEITLDYSEDYVVQGFGDNETEVEVLGSSVVEHRGQKALRQKLEARPKYRFMYCVESINRLIVPYEGWSADRKTKRAYFVAAGRCNADPRHQADLDRILSSFAPIYP